LGRVVMHGQRFNFQLSLKFMEGTMKRLSGLMALAAFLAFSMTSPLSFAGDEKKEEQKGGGGHVVVFGDEKKKDEEKGGHVVVFSDDQKGEEKGGK